MGRAEEPTEPNAASARRRADAALALLARHEPAFRRTARRVSICADDAEDALGRAVEILLTKAPPLQPPTLAAWMHVVTRREGLAVRRSRERALGRAGRTVELDTVLDRVEGEWPAPDEVLERRDRCAERIRALGALKPHERLAIVLQACGYSYAEIQRHCGWTYTKVNRCLAEGRARLGDRSADAG